MGPFYLEIFVFFIVHILKLGTFTGKSVTNTDIIGIFQFSFFAALFIITFQLLQTVHGLTRTYLRHEAFNCRFIHNFFK
ncbi:hypothetical protein CJ20_144 [Escherichia phage CJ20]|nr:hypothetical protein CJ20_144 [Escherichia phage CJ20]